jgi:hypothetical protein
LEKLNRAELFPLILWKDEEHHTKQKDKCLRWRQEHEDYFADFDSSLMFRFVKKDFGGVIFYGMITRYESPFYEVNNTNS